MQKNVQNNFVDIYEVEYVIELKTPIHPCHPLNDRDFSEELLYQFQQITETFVSSINNTVLQCYNITWINNLLTRIGTDAPRCQELSSSHFHTSQSSLSKPPIA